MTDDEPDPCIYNKITDITTILSNSGKPFHAVGLSELRLTINMPFCDLSIPGYSILRRDSKANNETGLIIYINDILSYKHLSHVDQPGVEAIRNKYSKSTPFWLVSATEILHPKLIVYTLLRQ